MARATDSAGRTQDAGHDAGHGGHDHVAMIAEVASGLSRDDLVVRCWEGRAVSEDAIAAAKAGAQVSVVHLMDRLMERQLDAPAAELVVLHRAQYDHAGAEAELGCKKWPADEGGEQ